MFLYFLYFNKNLLKLVCGITFHEEPCQFKSTKSCDKTLFLNNIDFEDVMKVILLILIINN